MVKKNESHKKKILQVNTLFTICHILKNQNSLHNNMNLENRDRIPTPSYKDTKTKFATYHEFGKSETEYQLQRDC